MPSFSAIFPASISENLTLPEDPEQHWPHIVQENERPLLYHCLFVSKDFSGRRLILSFKNDKQARSFNLASKQRVNKRSFDNTIILVFDYVKFKERLL